MSRESYKQPTATIAEPTLLIGIGDFGAEVIELLAEELQWHLPEGDQGDVANFAMVHVHAAEAVAPDDTDGWRCAEAFDRQLAIASGGDDSPTNALDFAILRSFGLIRFHDGQYQVARPADHGGLVLPPHQPESGEPRPRSRERSVRSRTPLMDEALDSELGPAERSAIGTLLGQFLEVPSWFVADLDDEAFTEADQPDLLARAEGLLAWNRAFRSRTFQWLNLDADPVAAFERLAQLRNSDADLARFIGPIMSQVREGFSPSVIRTVVARAAWYGRGADPSPWRWLREAGVAEPFRNTDALNPAAHPPRSNAESRVVASESCDILGADRQSDAEVERETIRVAEHFGVTDLSGFCRAVIDSADALESTVAERFQFVLPATFEPRYSEPCPVDPYALLSLDWSADSWSIAHPQRRGEVFRAAPLGALAFGFFDADRRTVDAEHWERFGERLQTVGTLVFRGLVRLWVDLQRGVDLLADCSNDERRRLEQSRVLLGRLVIARLDGAVTGTAASVDLGASTRQAPVPTKRVSLEVQRRRVGRQETTRNADAMFVERLRDLGLELPSPDDQRMPLVELVAVNPPQTPEVAAMLSGCIGSAELEDPGAIRRLREVVRKRVAAMLDFEQLKVYRNSETRTVPNVRIFVVGSLAEPVTRVSTRRILQEVHAEVLRAFEPIVDSFSTGRRRAVEILPCLSMPHPPDALPFRERGSVSAGQVAAQTGTLARWLDDRRGEESVIIEAVHRLRRWLESVPERHRFARDIMLFGRVNDRSVIGDGEALAQIRAFVWLHARNPVGESEHLTRLMTTDDEELLASVNVSEASAPAERLVAYLGNRFERDLLERFTDPRIHGSERQHRIPSTVYRFGRSSADATSDQYCEESRRELSKNLLKTLAMQCMRLGEGLAQIPRSIGVDRSKSVDELLRGFSPELVERLRVEIRQAWRSVEPTTSTQSALTIELEAIRRATGSRLKEATRQLHAVVDRSVSEALGSGGLATAEGILDETQRSVRADLTAAERERAKAEQRASASQVPDPGQREVLNKLQALRQRSESKPEWPAMRAGVVLFALIALTVSPSLGATLVAFAGWDRTGGLAEWLTGQVGWVWIPPLIGGLVYYAATRYADRHVTALTQDRDDLAAYIYTFVVGQPEGGKLVEHELAPALTRSLHHFAQTRGVLAAALQLRTLTLRTVEETTRDGDVFRSHVRRASNARLRVLETERDALGVRALNEQVGEHGTGLREDITGLQQRSKVSGGVATLISDEALSQFYQQTAGDESERAGAMPSYIQKASGYKNWRTRALFGASARCTAHSQAPFARLTESAIGDLDVFAESLIERLSRFVMERYPNVGHSAKFWGYEAFDDQLDNTGLVLVVSESTNDLLVRTSKAADVSDGVGKTADELLRLSGLTILADPKVKPNAAYLLMLAYGIRGRSFRNLARFETYHDRKSTTSVLVFPRAAVASGMRRTMGGTPIQETFGLPVRAEWASEGSALASLAATVSFSAGTNEPGNVVSTPEETADGSREGEPIGGEAPPTELGSTSRTES